MLKKIRIKIVSDRTELAGSLFEGRVPMPPLTPIAPAREEMTLEGRYHDDGVRVAISYNESALSGMEGSRATISFQKSEPARISMLRTGSVKTALLFEEGHRHACAYQTPLALFEVCVQTQKVQNAVEAMGMLELDYIVELKGAQPEHTKMQIVISPSYDEPSGIKR